MLLSNRPVRDVVFEAEIHSQCLPEVQTAVRRAKKGSGKKDLKGKNVQKKSQLFLVPAGELCSPRIE